MRAKKWRKLNPVVLWLVLLTFVVMPGEGETAELTGSGYLARTKIQWRVYGEAAFAEARRFGRPLFVLVFSDTCHWCRKYETEALEDSRVRVRIESKFIPVAVNFDRQPEVGRELGAKLVPASVILAPDGKKLLRFFGVQGAADLADTLDKTLALWRRGELAQPDFGDFETCCPVAKKPAPGSAREWKK